MTPAAQSVAQPMTQPMAYQRLGMVDTVGAGELPPDTECSHDTECPHPAKQSP